MEKWKKSTSWIVWFIERRYDGLKVRPSNNQNFNS